MKQFVRAHRCGQTPIDACNSRAGRLAPLHLAAPDECWKRILLILHCRIITQSWISRSDKTRLSPRKGVSCGGTSWIYFCCSITAIMAAQQVAQPPSPEGADADIVEIEHVIGYTGVHKHTLNCHPQLPNTYVFSLGAHVVVADTTDPHKQQFLRAHDETISSVVLSPTGALIASGQLGSRRAAVSAPIPLKCGRFSPLLLFVQCTKLPVPTDKRSTRHCVGCDNAPANLQSIWHQRRHQTPGVCSR